MRNLQDPELHEHENLTDSSNGFNRYDKTNDYSYLLEFLDQQIWGIYFIRKKKITRQSRDCYFPICFPGTYDKTYSNSNFSDHSIIYVHILESKLIMKREITIIDNILKVNCGFPTIDLFASRISLFVIAIQFQCIAA